MKKIYFVFAMLLMSITSALAEESSNELTPEEFFLTDYEITYYGNDFTVYGEACDKAGMVINGGRKITIRSNNGAKITKVEYAIGLGEEYSEHLMVSSGNVSSSDNFIYDVNATTLEIYSDVEGETDWFQIDYMKVFYEKADEGNNGENVKPLVLDEYVQTESLSIGYCDGRNVKITGTGTGGFDIANGNTVNITEKDHVDNITAKDHVEILKVELGLSADNNDALINSSAGIVEGSGENRTINNVNSSSLTISSIPRPTDVVARNYPHRPDLLSRTPAGRISYEINAYCLKQSKVMILFQITFSLPNFQSFHPPPVPSHSIVPYHSFLPVSCFSPSLPSHPALIPSPKRAPRDSRSSRE